MSPLFTAVRRALLPCLPCAALLAACAALPPSASAQYQSAAGWHPVKPNGTVGSDTLGDPYVFYSYDWSPLSLVFGGVHGPYRYDTYSGTEVYTPNTSSGFQYLDGGPSYPPYPGQPTPPDRTLNLTIGGTSTIKYQWVPPNDPVSGLPDFRDFPAPPLFVLGRVDGRAKAYSNSGDLSGVSGRGSFADGFGDPAFSFTGVPGDTGLQTGWGVLSAVGSPAQVHLSPGVSVSLLGTGTGSAVGGGQIAESVFPITLSAPYPFERPDLGDGYNQYVYDTQPNGELDVVSQILLPGASSDDAIWMLADPTTPYADLYFTPTISGQQPYQWQPYSGSIIPRTITPTKTVTDGLSFVGLPQDDSGFGDHTAVMKVYSNYSYHDSQAAHIQTFFDGESIASNWPGADGRPNWFYYYNQIYPYNQFQYQGVSYDLQPHPGTIGAYSPELTAVGASTAEDTTNPTSISLNPDLWRFSVVVGPKTLNSVNLPVFIISSEKKIVNIGVMKLKGINAYERVCAHEQAHIKLWLGCKDQTGIFAFPPFRNPLAPGSTDPYPWIDNKGNPIVDTDGDGIPDNVEREYGLEPTEADSTGFFTENGRVDAGTFGDVECLCEIAALGEVVKHKGDCLVDWSSTGLQYGSHPMYPDVPPGVFYPYEFLPTDIAYPFPSIDPPGSSLMDWDQIISDIASK